MLYRFNRARNGTRTLLASACVSQPVTILRDTPRRLPIGGRSSPSNPIHLARQRKSSRRESRMHLKACSALCVLLLAACTTHADGTQSANKTAVGATVGALAGGVLGNRLDKDKRV